MPVQPINFAGIPPQGNPIAKNLVAALQNAMMFPQDLKSKQLQNMIDEAKAKYADPMAQADLKTKQQHNAYDPRIWDSEIGLRGSQSRHLGTEADLNNYKLNNPAYINPEASLIQAALDRQKQLQSQPQYQPQPQPMQGSGGASPQPQMSPMQQMASNVSNSLQSQAPSSMGGAPSQSSTDQGNDSINPNALIFNPPQLSSPTGSSELDNIYFKKFGMAPVQQAQLELSQTQATENKKQNLEALKDMREQLPAFNQATIDSEKFIDVLDKISSGKMGPIIGRFTPNIGKEAQQLEAIGANLVASASQAFQRSGHVNESDVKLQQMAKPGIHQDKEVAFDLAHGMLAKSGRMKEKQAFYTAGTNMGVKAEVLDAMWNNFETQRPYVDTQTGFPNYAYKGSWKDYLNPRAINAAVEGKDYVPKNQTMLEAMNFNKDDLRELKANGYTKQDLYKTMKETKKSMPQLKMLFIERSIIHGG